ncbi:MAG: polysaccharide biosynthesis/export protein, partial [Acetobacteraceae bacterium]|nr:polysaccharide biosynthesis/export protein [Acetobacteraceae bacterium]
DILVAGIPEFRQHVAIGLEGNIGLPLAGRISVGGLSLADAQARVTTELANKLYRQYAADGREISHLILGTEVVVEVSEYSPVYVNGDVSKPGAYPFRPGMTIRQAIAVAGGYNPIRTPTIDPVLQLSDLQSQYATLQVQYQADLALVGRLKNELNPGDGKNDDNQKDLIAGTPAETFVRGEAESLAARRTSTESIKASLQAAVKQASVQLSLLEEKRAQDEEGSKADVADFGAVRELFQKGLAPSLRLSEARRAALMSSQQLLQTIAQINEVQRQRGDYARQLQQVDNQARIDDLDRMQQTVRHIAELRSTMKGVSDKLALIGGLHTDRTSKAQLSVFRNDVDGATRVSASDDLKLVPGDVIEVALPGDTNGPLASAAPLR